MKSIFDELQIKFIRENYSSMTYREIAEKLGFSEKQVRAKALNLGLTKTRRFDKNYFDQIDSREKAYFLGLIYADGYIVNGPHSSELGIELNEGDRYILERFSEELGGVHQVDNRSREISFNGYTYISHTSFVRVYSKKIAQDLEKHGVTTNKTSSEEFPIVEEFFFDFLRGFFDGDGCFYVGDSNMQISFTNSNSIFLQFLREEIERRIGCSGKLYTEKERKHRLVYFKKNDEELILRELYRDTNLYLSRKYQHYQAVFGPSCQQ